MKIVFDDFYKKMAIELSYHKWSLINAAKDLEIYAGRVSKWQTYPCYNGGKILPKKR